METVDLKKGDRVLYKVGSLLLSGRVIEVSPNLKAIRVTDEALSMPLINLYSLAQPASIEHYRWITRYDVLDKLKDGNGNS